MELIFLLTTTRVLQAQVIQWMLLTTAQYHTFQDLALIGLKQLCLQLSLFKSTNLWKGLV